MKANTIFKKWQWLLMFCCYLLIFQNAVRAQSVDVWVTNTGERLKQRNDIPLSGRLNNATINIDENATRQTIDGFGFMLNQGSAKLIRQMSNEDQDLLIDELFKPNSGISNSIVRISIAASDLSDSVYFYNNTPGDTNMNTFSLDNTPDSRDLFPILRKIVNVNPSIKILATPWSAPSWMKDNNNSKGGSLQSRYHEAYARYFVKYLQAMKEREFNIWGITPQNEPLNPGNQPSMFMSASQQFDFVDNHLGPQMQNAGFGNVKIIGYDHNFDRLDYPKEVARSRFVDGSAFHAYDNSGPGGSPNTPGMGEVFRETGKDVYFTEQFTGTGGDFNGDLGWHMRNVVIGSLRNFSKTVIEWNLVSDRNPADGPKTEGDGGCTTCLGAFTIDGGDLISRNVSYYIIGAISKFVQPGAVRLQSNESSVLNVAFRNPDGSRVLLVYNEGADRNISVNSGSNSFSYRVPGNSATTFVWSGNTITRPNPPTGLTATAGDRQIKLQWNASSGATEYIIRRALPGGSYSTIKSGVTGTSYINRGLTNGQRYWYVVRARNSAGTSNSSSAVSAIPRAAPSGIISGNVYEIKNRASGKVMDVSGVSIQNGARIQQWASSGGENQQWRVESTGGNQYKLTAIHSGKVLDVVNGSTNRGARIQQWDDFGSSNQRWKIEGVGNGYYTIISVKSDLALDVPGGNSENGVQIMQWTTHGRNNQQWSFKLVPNKSSVNVLYPESKDILVSPNPTDGSNFKAFFSLPTGDQFARVSILDVTGKELHSFTFEMIKENQQEILLDSYVKSLPIGRYFLKINEKTESFLKL